MQTAPRFPIRAEKIKKTDMEFVHKSVLFDESIKALELNKNKLIVDGTAGGGGHAREIAKQAGRLIAVDQNDSFFAWHKRYGRLFAGSRRQFVSA